MVDRRQRKVERKRKKRVLAKRTANARTARRPDWQTRLIRSASRAPFGPCAVSVGWETEGDMPSLVTVVVTRVLGDGRLFPGVAMVDRTCLGVKNGFPAQPVTRTELPGLLDEVFMVHGGWKECQPLVAQLIVFRAVDYAHRLGFEPHPDAELVLFGPRPSDLLATPWCAPSTPVYLSGPDDDVEAIMAQLEKTAGAGNFDFVAHVTPFDIDEDGDREEDDALEDEDR